MISPGQHHRVCNLFSHFDALLLNFYAICGASMWSTWMLQSFHLLFYFDVHYMF